jgi:hypothetical protein
MASEVVQWRDLADVRSALADEGVGERMAKVRAILTKIDERAPMPDPARLAEAADLVAAELIVFSGGRSRLATRTAQRFRAVLRAVHAEVDRNPATWAAVLSEAQTLMGADRRALIFERARGPVERQALIAGGALEVAILLVHRTRQRPESIPLKARHALLAAIDGFLVDLAVLIGAAAGYEGDLEFVPSSRRVTEHDLVHQLGAAVMADRAWRLQWQTKHGQR